MATFLHQIFPTKVSKYFISQTPHQSSSVNSGNNSALTVRDRGLQMGLNAEATFLSKLANIFLMSCQKKQ